MTPPVSPRLWPLLLGGAGLAATAACLAFVAVAPDTRLRIVLADDPAVGDDPASGATGEDGGVTVVATEGLTVWGGTDPAVARPRSGDVLRELGGRRVRGPLDFYAACDPLFEMTAEDFAPANADDSATRAKITETGWTFVSVPDGRRFVRVRFDRAGAGPGAASETAFVEVRGAPTGRLWLFLSAVISNRGSHAA